jgi:DNA (cytosine-5)-methyltransferase 3A
MIVLSLFDGMACGYQALKDAGIYVEKYYASEVDKHAIQIAKKNHPDIIHLGDVTKWREWSIPKPDLIIGGSPCQGFSFAGKQLAFEDPRSKLFFEFVAILDHYDPRHFLLENVRMKTEHLDVISEYLGVEPVCINSALVSAQNRVRFYWCNWKVNQPKDKGIMLKDIVHENIDMSFAEKDCWVKWFKENADYQLSKKYSSSSADKAITMTARQYASWNGNFVFENLIDYIVPFDDTLMILNKEVEKGKVGYFRTDSQANRVYYIHDKAVTLCGDSGGGAAKMGQYLFGCISPDRIEKRQNGQRFNDGNKFYTLTAQDKHGILTEGYIRKLTPIECERLQTLPDNYTGGGVQFTTIQDAWKWVDKGCHSPHFLAHAT